MWAGILGNQMIGLLYNNQNLIAEIFVVILETAINLIMIETAQNQHHTLSTSR